MLNLRVREQQGVVTWQEFRATLKNLWKAHRSLHRMKKRLQFIKGSNMLNLKFTKWKKYIQIGQCRIVDDFGARIEMED